jgi:hypothetical protein
VSTLGAFVVTRDGANRLQAVIANLQQFADRVIVYIDARSTDDSWNVARMMGVEVISEIPEGGMPEGAFADCVARLNTDWLLHLDDDELLGPDFVARLPRLLHNNIGWRFPRYHVYPDEGQYITSQPYYPDFQMRLIPRKLWNDNFGWPVRAHVSPAWPCSFATCGLFHYKFLLHSREDREARMAQWIANWPGAANEHYRAFSIVEGQTIETAAIPEPLPAQRFERLAVAA